MKIHKIYHNILFFSIFCVVGTISAKHLVFIKNQYKDPIVVNLDGHDIRILKKGEFDHLTYWPKHIKIRTEKGTTYHSGIDKEYQKIVAAKNNPNLTATIIILNSNNPFFFDYDTSMELGPNRPQTSSPSDLKKVLTEQLLKNAITPESFLIKLTQQPYAYGKDYADKIIFIKNISQRYSGTNKKNRPDANLEEYIHQNVIGRVKTLNVSIDQAEASIKERINEILSLTIPQLQREGKLPK